MQYHLIIQLIKSIIFPKTMIIITSSEERTRFLDLPLRYQAIVRMADILAHERIFEPIVVESVTREAVYFEHLRKSGLNGTYSMMYWLNEIFQYDPTNPDLDIAEIFKDNWAIRFCSETCNKHIFRG